MNDKEKMFAYETALRFYADTKSYIKMDSWPNAFVINDNGRRAREALEVQSTATKPSAPPLPSVPLPSVKKGEHWYVALPDQTNLATVKINLITSKVVEIFLLHKGYDMTFRLSDVEFIEEVTD